MTRSMDGQINVSQVGWRNRGQNDGGLPGWLVDMWMEGFLQIEKI